MLTIPTAKYMYTQISEGVKNKKRVDENFYKKLIRIWAEAHFSYGAFIAWQNTSDEEYDEKACKYCSDKLKRLYYQSIELKKEYNITI